MTIKMLADGGKEEQVSDLVKKIFICGSDCTLTSAAIENGKRTTEVVDVSDLPIAKADVARRENRGRYRREVVVARRLRKKRQPHVYVLERSRMEVEKIPAHLLHQVGGGARNFQREAVETKMLSHGSFMLLGFACPPLD